MFENTKLKVREVTAKAADSMADASWLIACAIVLAGFIVSLAVLFLSAVFSR